MSEELRDDHFNSKLREAFDLKLRSLNNEALEIYQDVLQNEFLKDSNVEKHVFMRFNALKNSGELYERTGNFIMAKNHYTLALKIKDKEPFVWTRLGFIEYDGFQNLTIAKRCFEAAAQTCTTFERRSAKINLLLFKLAEIYFQEFDMHASEQMVDGILQRLDNKVPPTPEALFACLMKSFFLSLRGETIMASGYLDKARTIKPAAQVTDLDVIKKMKGAISLNLRGRDMMVDGVSLMNQSPSMDVIVIQPTRERYQSTIECIEDFLLQLAHTCEKVANSGQISLENTRLNFDNCIQILSDQLSLLSQGGAHQQQLSRSLMMEEADYQAQLNRLDAVLNNLVTESPPQTGPSDQIAPIQTKEAPQSKKKNAQGAGNQRTLRRKPDSTEQQMRQYTVAPLKDFLEFTLDRNYKTQNILGVGLNSDFEVVVSNKEIMNAKAYFEKQIFLNEDTPMVSRTRSNVVQDSMEGALNRLQIYREFLDALLKLNGKATIFTLRSLLRFCLEDPIKLNCFITFNLASNLYRIFVSLLQGDFSRPVLDQCFSRDQFVLLTLFEISLFNMEAIKEIKPTSLIYQREKLFEYFQFKELELLCLLERSPTSMPTETSRKKVRLFYAMMYYAFEIKNNMHASIAYFQKLQDGSSSSNEQYQTFPVAMPWVSMTFIIDESKVAEYGGIKITKAQVVKANDEELIQLKMAEVKENEDAKRANMHRSVISRVKPEFVKYACFYLDQLCHYLQKAYQSGDNTANLSTNEEKIKEMWGKLMYSMCRCPTSKMVKLANSLFSVLTAFQYLSKTFYEQFILKKLEFEPFLTELNERLKLIYNGIIIDQLKTNQRSLIDLREALAPRLSAELLETDSEDAVKVLAKLQVHLLRLMSCEFLFHNVINNITKLVEGQNLLQAYFTELFFIELFLVILRATNEDLVEQLKPIIIMIKRFDKISLKNNEAFIKPYFKLLVVAGPCLISIMAGHLQVSKDIIQQQWVSEQNDLVQLVMQISDYFFDIKFSPSDLNINQSKEEVKDEEPAPEEEDDDGSEDEKKKYKLKCLKKMRDKSNKYWSVILGALLPGGLSQLQTGISGSQSNQQLQYLYQVSGSIDVYLLRDMAFICNAVTKGRLSGFGIMVPKDITNIVTFIDILARYLIENIKSITAHDQFNEKLELFKHCIGSKGNPLAFNTQVAQIGGGSTSLQSEAISSLSFFLMNIMSHLALDNAASQQLLQIKNNPKRKKLLETMQLPALYANNKILKNLRSISQLDIVYSGFSSVESLLLQSQVTCEYFILANTCKQTLEYRGFSNYISFKNAYNLSLNVLVVAIQCLFTEMRDLMNNQPRSSNKWHNISLIMKLKQAFSQALFIVTSKMQANRYLLKRSPHANLIQGAGSINHTSLSSQDFIERKVQKVKNLSEQALVLADICEKLEKLTVVAEDPRLSSKQKDILQCVLHITETFLGVIQNSSSLNDRVRFCIQSDRIQDFTAKINNATQDFKQKMDQIKLKTSFEYPYLQALLSGPNKNITFDYHHLKHLNHCLEVAFTNSSVQGCLEIFIQTLRQALHLGIILRYQPETLSHHLKESLALYESVTKNLMGDKKSIYKLILTQFNSTATSSPKQEIQQVDDYCEVMRDKEEGDDVEILLDNNVSASIVRPELFKNDEIPEFNSFESTLQQLYKIGDQLYQLMSSHSSYLWARVRLQYNLTKELQFEIKLNPIMEGKLEAPIIEKLAEMMHSTIGSIQMQEEQENSNFYMDVTKKNLVSQYRHSEIALSDLRIKVKTFYIQLNEKQMKYEYIKDLFKRQQHLVKMSERQNSSGLITHAQRSIELQNIFNLSKDKYLETYFIRIKQQLDLYMSIRKKLKDSQKQKPETVEICKKTYKELREKISVTKDVLPSMLKDIFELFIDSHSRKSLLSTKRLIDDSQKRQIRQAVLLCCAYCGPDSDFESNKITSKFLDLARISGDDEYEGEGLIICIKWYIGCLEEQHKSAKKDSDSIKKLKAIMDDIDRAMKEQKATNEENMARQVFNEAE